MSPVTPRIRIFAKVVAGIVFAASVVPFLWGLIAILMSIVSGVSKKTFMEAYEFFVAACVPFCLSLILWLLADKK